MRMRCFLAYCIRTGFIEGEDETLKENETAVRTNSKVLHCGAGTSDLLAVVSIGNGRTYKWAVTIARPLFVTTSLTGPLADSTMSIKTSSPV